MKYKKKPVVVEAFKWTGDIEQLEDPEWIVEAIKNKDAWFINQGTENVKMVIDTLIGDMTANKGDYIVNSMSGVIHPCKPDVFEKTYELAE